MNFKRIYPYFFWSVLIFFGSQACHSAEPSSEPTKNEIVDYFMEIAIGSELGAAKDKIVRWDQDLRIKVMGDPKPEDREVLSSIIKELNVLLSGIIKIALDENNANVNLYFVPREKFPYYEKNYVKANSGFFWAWWDHSCRIIKAKILIPSENVSQEERSHLIREELTQSLGLMNDSWSRKDSIFYQGKSFTQEYSEMDKEIIRLLYSHIVSPGMTAADIRKAFISENVRAE